jgi:hypothetical protein
MVMKLVREHINEVFTDDSDPIQDMGIGMLTRIKEWFDISDIKFHVENLKIRKDGKINASQVDISYEKYHIIPWYIKFGKISGDFSCSFSDKNELKQLPKYIGGKLNIFPGPTHNTTNFTKKDILKICKIKPENIVVYKLNSVRSYEEIKIN